MLRKAMRKQQKTMKIREHLWQNWENQEISQCQVDRILLSVCKLLVNSPEISNWCPNRKVTNFAIVLVFSYVYHIISIFLCFLKLYSFPSETERCVCQECNIWLSTTGFLSSHGTRASLQTYRYTSRLSIIFF